MSAPLVYRLLVDELYTLIAKTYANNAFVFDASGLVLCAAIIPGRENRERLFAQIRVLVGGLKPPLRRGGKLSGRFHVLRPVHCESFATIYVLAVWPTEATVEFELRREIRSVLPRVKALTLALPPLTSGPKAAALRLQVPA